MTAYTELHLHITTLYRENRKMSQVLAWLIEYFFKYTIYSLEKFLSALHTVIGDVTKNFKVKIQFTYNEMHRYYMYSYMSVENGMNWCNLYLCQDIKCFRHSTKIFYILFLVNPKAFPLKSQPVFCFTIDYFCQF